jgi:hypothetical protein
MRQDSSGLLSPLANRPLPPCASLHIRHRVYFRGFDACSLRALPQPFLGFLFVCFMLIVDLIDGDDDVCVVIKIRFSLLLLSTFLNYYFQSRNSY